MKLDEFKYNRETIDIVNQSQVIQTQINWTIKNLPKGHTLFEINLETGIVQPAIFDEDVDVQLSRIGTAANLQTIKKKVRQQKDCVYLGALNKKNAIRKWYQQAQKLL
jgi:hypothetical protein